MTELVMTNEAPIRLGFFFGVLAVMAAWELLAPRRRLTVSKALRWTSFNLPWWDRLLGTYRAQPEAGHEGMTLGIGQFREAKYLRLDRMLVQPFLGDAHGYPIGERAGGGAARTGQAHDAT
jgi:hypothetical protein